MSAPAARGAVPVQAGSLVHGETHVAAGSSRRRPPLPLGPALILGAYLGLAVWYSMVTPILEASDENWHEPVVWSITAGHGLPVITPSDRGSILVPRQEAGQPPLYYLLAAAVSFWARSPAPGAAVRPNFHADIGHPDRSAWNKNLLVHDASEDFPWHGLALAVHLQRLLSVLFGALTVIAVSALARQAAPRSATVPILAASFAAFNPMLLFISASVDNDALAIALSTLVLCVLARALRREVVTGHRQTGKDQPVLRGALACGVLLGLATLTKLSAAAIAAPAIAVYLWLAWERRSLRLAGRAVAALLLPAALLSGWWFARNGQLYGDPLGLHAFLQVAGQRDHPLGFGSLLKEFPSVWTGFWGVFGIFDILLPPGYAAVIDLLAAVAGVGLLVSLWRWANRRRRVQPVLVLLAGWLLLEVLLLARWTAQTEASSGRLLFPAIGSVATLLALGLAGSSRRLGAVVALGVSGLLLVGAALAVPLAILPAYAAPPFVSAAALQPALRLGYRYGNLELVGVTLPAGPLLPGSTAPVTLYWWTLGPIGQDEAVSVQLHGPDVDGAPFLVAQTDALPGGGKVLTTRWPAGKGLVETIPVPINRASPAPSLAHLAVLVYPADQPDRAIGPRQSDGAPATPEAGRLEVRSAGAAPLAATVAPAQVFGGQIALSSAELPAQVTAGQNLALGLHWLALRSPDAAYTVFVHVVTGEGRLVAQQDQQPHAGKLPTSDWVAGEVVTDRLSVPIPAGTPPGRFAVLVGLYWQPSGTRLLLPGGATERPIGDVTIQAGAGP